MLVHSSVDKIRKLWITLKNGKKDEKKEGILA
jgi:hypothetical protein